MTAWIAKASAPLLAVAALFLIGALCAYLAISKVSDMVGQAARTATESRDAHWQAAIQASEAQAQRVIAENLTKTMAAQDAARDQVADANARAAELEKDNAALPDTGACGLGRDRIRLLNKR